jgi:endo-1,4-beta-xylanase
MPSFSAVLVLALLVSSSAPGESPLPLPPGGRSMLAQPGVAGLRFSAAAETATAEVVTVKGMPFDQAIRVAIQQQPREAWGVQLAAETNLPIRRGDVLLVSYFLKGLSSTDESGQVAVTAHVQQNRAPHTKLATLPGQTAEQWRHIVRSFVADRALDASENNFVFHLGYAAQTFLIGGVELLNYGPDADLTAMPQTPSTYAGREANAPWRAQAVERIERHRKDDFAIEVVDAAGRPVVGAQVHVAMTRHAFGFGSAVTAQMLAAETEDGRRYREIVQQYYNKVVFENDLKWRPWLIAASNTHQTYRRQWLDTAFAWLADRDIAVRGHYLIWAPLERRWQPEDYTQRPDDLRRDTLAHVEEKALAVGERVAEWDAINHIAGWGTTYADVFGGNAIYAEIIRRGRKLVPNVEMWVNEGQILTSGMRHEEYLAIVGDLVKRGAAPDGVGFMGHFADGTLTPMQVVYQRMDAYARIVPRLQLTEFDVDVGIDEILQADYLRDVMTLAFSHPHCEAIVMWGFWEGRHWKPHAALYRRDWSIKPAGQAWKDLVFGDWWTDTRGQSDQAGRFTARGFHGQYTVTVRRGGTTATQEATLAPGGLHLRVTLAP